MFSTTQLCYNSFRPHRILLLPYQWSFFLCLSDLHSILNSGEITDYSLIHWWMDSGKCKNKILKSLLHRYFGFKDYTLQHFPGHHVSSTLVTGMPFVNVLISLSLPQQLDHYNLPANKTNRQTLAEFKLLTQVLVTTEKIKSHGC